MKPTLSLYSSLMSYPQLTPVAHHYRRSEMIYHQETPCFGIHFLKSGSVKLFTQEEDGREIIHKIATPGECLGAGGFFTNKNHAECAKALEPIECYFIEGAQLHTLMEQFPDLNIHFLQMLSFELKESNHRHADMIRKNVRERLASFFIQMQIRHAPQDVFSPHMSREEIASYIGSAHETVIRCISEFKELGYIEEENKSFRILNSKELQSLGGICL